MVEGELIFIVYFLIFICEVGMYIFRYIKINKIYILLSFKKMFYNWIFLFNMFLDVYGYIDM